MQYQRVEIGLGEELLQPFDGKNYYCPICAANHGDRPSYYSDGHPAYGCICPDCSMHPGFDDEPRNNSVLTQKQYVAAYRKRWLYENEWAAVLVDRLRAVFQLSDEDIEFIRQAEELK